MKKVMIICAAVVFAASAMAVTPLNVSLNNVECGSTVTIKATPKTGFHFVKWEDDETAPAERTITTIDDATLKNYKAIFAADETVVDPSIDPGVDFPVAHGTTLHLTPHTDDDCEEFVHWSDITDPNDPNYAANPRDFEYNGVLPTFTAVFRTKTYTVNATAEDDTQGEIEITVVTNP